ncbi:MAG: ABC transporter substrate-binding protein [Pseudomonadota bacterium]
MTAFKALYPFISIKYFDDDGALVYQRFMNEVAAGRPTADLVWSSAMDLQEKLINDGYAQPYSTPEMSSIPSWAHWKDLGYGSTSEPIVFVYNRRFLSHEEMPRTHAALKNLLDGQVHRFSGRVAVYDPEKSEVGMLFLSQDLRITRDAWNLFQAFANVDAKVYSTSRDILRHIAQGDQWIGYDVIASYAFEMQKSHPELEVVYPSDYVLTMSRVSFITANARHPNSAKLFLDFLLSRAGQRNLVNYGMGSVRSDVGFPANQAKLDPVRTQAIRIGPGLLADLDSLVRAQFLRRWRQMRATASPLL